MGSKRKWSLWLLGLTLVWSGLLASSIADPVGTAQSAGLPAEPADEQVTRVPPPAQPLRAWTVAPGDGAVFVVDATCRLYQLATGDLTPLARSEPLFEGADKQSNFLLASDTHLFAGSTAITQTLVLDRRDFQQVAMLNGAGPLALDPGRRLFMVSEWALWAYSLAAAPSGSPLSGQSPMVVIPAPRWGLGSAPVDLAADPKARRLYVIVHDYATSPPHQHEFCLAYDLDSLAEVGESKGQLGSLIRPTVAGRTGLVLSTLYAKSGFFSANKLLTLDRQGQVIQERQPLDGIPAVDAEGSWLYLLRERGLWVLHAADLSLQSVLPFTQRPPTDLLLSPDGKTLYLFGNGWLTALSTPQLQALGLPPVSPFPLAWTDEKQNHRSFAMIPEFRVFPSPEMDKDSIALVQIGWYGETYRSTDGGRSWNLLLSVTYPKLQDTVRLSLSPTFATDHTLTARFRPIMRSTDGGETWTEWTPRIAFASDRGGNRDIYTMNQEGKDVRQVTADPAAEENPAWSPAWTWLAFQSNRNGNWDIFTVKADCDPQAGETSDRCGLQQLTDSPADDLLPAWSPDGRSIAFVSTRDGNPEIYVMDKDGQNPRRLTFSPTGDWRPAWLPDSRHLLFTSDRGGNNDIYRIEVPPSGSAPLTSEIGLTPVVTGPSDDRDPAVSAHDQLVFLSNREGLMRAYTLDLTWRGAEPHLLRDAKQTDGHPSWVDDASYAVLVAIERKGVSHIYRTCYSCEDEVLAPSRAFDGHPAWGPVWWLPDASASVEWLKGHQ